MKLTTEDRFLLKALEKNRFIYICRNEDGDLVLVNGKSYNHKGCWYSDDCFIGGDYSCLLDLNNDMFSFITFENSPWSNEDLLKLETE